jgi:hypothetical protein
LRLLGRQLVQFIGNAKILVIRQQVLQSHIGVDAAAGSGSHLCFGTRLLLLRRRLRFLLTLFL